VIHAVTRIVSGWKPFCIIGMGVIFSRWGAVADFSRGSHKDFSRGAKSGESSFLSLEIKKTTFFAKCNGEISNFKIRGGLSPLPPFRRP